LEVFRRKKIQKKTKLEEGRYVRAEFFFKKRKTWEKKKKEFSSRETSGGRRGVLRKGGNGS